MDIKICITCKISKNISDFELRSDTNKRRNQCRSCRNEYVQTYKSKRKNGLNKKHIEIKNNEKQCRICKKWKNLDLFPKRKTKHGFRHECYECKTNIMRKYYKDKYNKIRVEKRRKNINFRILCNHRNYIYKCLTRYKNKKII